MPEPNYTKILDYCKKWYSSEAKGVPPFPKSSEFHPEHFNDLGAAVKKPDFKEFDLIRIDRGRFSSDEFFLFVTTPSFVPKTQENVCIKDLSEGKWNYRGHIFSLSDSGDVSYKTTPSNFPEKALSLIYRKN